MKSPILGSSYVTRSINEANNRLINLYPELVPEGGKEPAFLNRCPGLNLEVTVGNGPIRGLWSAKEYLFVVSGNSFYRIGPNLTDIVLVGTISGTDQVSISDNGIQVFIACNPDGYIYNMNTNIFAPIIDEDYPGAVTVTFLDGYFLFNQPNSQKIWATQLYDGSSIEPLDFTSAEASPDDIAAVIAIRGELWVFGENSIQVYYNASLESEFPFLPIQGSFNEVGCIAPYSVAKVYNSLVWLGQDKQGQGIVFRNNGYSAEQISTPAIEYEIQQYSTLSDAIAYGYQQEGHYFYVLIFPSANKTWVYDAITGAWHERAGWNNGSFVRHRSNCFAFYKGLDLVGDFENGNIYSFNLDVFTDNSQIQKWLRSWRALPTGVNNLTRTSQHSLQLDCESGVGLNSGQGSNPQVMLRWSDDGGHTWSNEYWVSMGRIGTTGTRVIWRRLGMTMKLRDRVYEVSGTDPVKIAIMGAELIVSPTNA